MGSNGCQICLSDRRPVKFKSNRIRICQWCVTLLQNAPVNPEAIKNHIWEIAKKHVESPPEKPDEEQIREKAREAIIGDEPLISNILNSLFNSRKREEKINMIHHNLLDNARDVYSEKLNFYNENLNSNIQKKYEKLLSGEFNPKELTHFFAKRDIFHSRWYTPIRSGYKDALKGEDKNYLKYLRAFRLCLISTDGKEKRIDESEMQAIRRNLRAQDNNTCRICRNNGRQLELHVHHIIPIDIYGSNHKNNLITLCHKCHNKQHPDIQVTRNLPIKRDRTGGEFVAIDIETTGLSPSNDRIIEIAAVRFDGGKKVEEFKSLINPGVPVPYKITRLTGITDEMVSNAPGIKQVYIQFLDFVGDSKIVAHHARFDLGFLHNYGKRFGYALENEVVDTLRLSRKKLPNLENHKLQTLIRHFGIRVRSKHRAYSDCYATGLIYIYCLRTKKR